MRFSIAFKGAGKKPVAIRYNAAMNARYCSECGFELGTSDSGSTPAAGSICPRCETDCHLHPQILLTVFLSCGDKLLWMRRAHAPKPGLWAIPGGYREPGESLAAGAARELWEETGIELQPEQLNFYMTGTITYINQIYVGFRGRVDTEDCVAGKEALEVGFFSRHELPWDQVAYPEVNNSVLCAYADLEAHSYRVYHAELTPERNEILPVMEQA